MALTHEFILIPEDTDPLFYLQKLHWNESGDVSINEDSDIYGLVKISDDVILYIMDSLNWIPTFNPSTRKKGYGLNYYGITVIKYMEDHDGATVAQNIFNSWAELFSHAPETITLKGEFMWEEDGHGEYEKISINRDEIVASLRTLASFAEQAIRDNKQVLHCGI
jgi:hypothetical protein